MPSSEAADSAANRRPQKRGDRGKRQKDAPRDPRSGERSTGRSTPGGKRHQARIVALQILYEIDLTDHPTPDVLDRTFVEQDLPAQLRRHVERLVTGSLSDRERIDRYIAAAAPAFPVAQLPSVDRNVLRLAIHELLNEPEVPAKVAINEAVELAKRFGGANSGRFVNGVLGTVAERIAVVDGDRAHDDQSAAE